MFTMSLCRFSLGTPASWRRKSRHVWTDGVELKARSLFRLKGDDPVKAKYHVTQEDRTKGGNARNNININKTKNHMPYLNNQNVKSKNTGSPDPGRVGVNSCAPVSVSSVIDWQPVLDVSRLSPYESWDNLQHPVTLSRTVIIK